MNPRAAGPAAALIATALLAACALPPEASPASLQGGLIEILQRPAERALLAGMRAYDDGLYAVAERELKKALASGLVSGRDRAAAHKHLAFVYCTSRRPKPCEEALRAARAAYPEFVLSRAEAGHPSWGPVYKRVVASP